MLHGEHSAILSTFIKLPFVIKIVVLSIFEWSFYTDFTVHCAVMLHCISKKGGKDQESIQLSNSMRAEQYFCFNNSSIWGEDLAYCLLILLGNRKTIWTAYMTLETKIKVEMS